MHYTTVKIKIHKNTIYRYIHNVQQKAVVWACGNLRRIDVFVLEYRYLRGLHNLERTSTLHSGGRRECRQLLLEYIFLKKDLPSLILRCFNDSKLARMRWQLLGGDTGMKNIYVFKQHLEVLGFGLWCSWILTDWYDKAVWNASTDCLIRWLSGAVRWTLCTTHLHTFCRQTSKPLQTPPPQPFYDRFSGPPGWAGARRELLDFMVQGLSLIHIWRCRRSTLCRSRWSPYH